MALQATFLDDDDRSVEAQWRASVARDWPSWLEALRHFTAPIQNMVYADRDGNIGFWLRVASLSAKPAMGARRCRAGPGSTIGAAGCSLRSYHRLSTRRRAILRQPTT